MQKKYQVFISSTYTDLIEERQQAVLAVLKANHIPAGMELFKAGSLDQLQTIERWIDESDIYMLILGGRYGTLEPKSKKSYTHLEFEYALKSKIPIFVIQLTNNMLKIKSLGPSLKDADVYEQKNKNKYRDFKSLVAGHNRVVAYVDNTDQIKSEVLGSINEIIHLNDLKGWVREERTFEYETNRKMQHLTDENNRLYAEISMLKQNSLASEKIGNFTFDEIIRTLDSQRLEMDPSMWRLYDLRYQENPTFLELFRDCQRLLLNGIPTLTGLPVHRLLLGEFIPTLQTLNLVELVTTQKVGSSVLKSWILNSNGQTFLGKLKLQSMNIPGQF